MFDEKSSIPTTSIRSSSSSFAILISNETSGTIVEPRTSEDLSDPFKTFVSRIAEFATRVAFQLK